MTRLLSSGCLLLCACTPSDVYHTSGEVLYEHFPFDGVRSWEYVSDDLDVTYRLDGHMRSEDPDPGITDGADVYHIDYRESCAGCSTEVVRTIGWSSDVRNGTRVHVFESGGDRQVFDPPLIVAPPEVDVGESTETDTGGTTWTATLVGFEPCDGVVHMQDSQFARSNCAAHIALSDGAGAYHGLAGDYWVSRGLGIVGIRLEGESATWGLSKMECEPTEECDGTW